MDFDNLYCIDECRLVLFSAFLISKHINNFNVGVIENSLE